MKESIRQLILMPLACSLLLWGPLALAEKADDGIGAPVEIPVTAPDRQQLEANIIAIFGGQMMDGGYQLEVALQSATMSQLQALQNAPDLDALQVILSGAQSKKYAQRVGDLEEDYSFTPVVICRLADTRVVGGSLAPGENRAFYAYGSDMSDQGGISTGCSLPTGRGEPYGVFLKMTAIPQSGSGTVSAYPANIDAPATGSILFYKTSSQNISNTAPVKTHRFVGPEEFRVLNRFGTTHLVIDILGYYYAPEIPAGVDYVSSNTTTDLTTSDAVISSLDVTMPSDGHCLINASGYFNFYAQGAIARCSITTGNVVDFSKLIISSSQSTGTEVYSTWASTQGFAQEAGVVTYNLVCEKTSAGTARVIVGDPRITAHCTSERY